jgi:hypothetical protein
VHFRVFLSETGYIRKILKTVIHSTSNDNQYECLLSPLVDMHAHAQGEIKNPPENRIQINTPMEN